MLITIQKIFGLKLLNIILLFFLISYTAIIFYLFKVNNYSGFNSFIFSHKVYFFIILSQVFLLIIVLFKNNNFKKNFILAYLSISFALFISEIFLSILDLNRSQESSIELYKKFKKVGEIKYPYFRPGYYISDNLNKNKIYPLSSISNSSTILCNEKERKFYTSDKYGFNNKNEVWNENIDIVLIGDSFTHGSCVDNENNVAERLKKYNNKNVLNLGFSGSGPLIELAILREYASKIKPKTLLWLYYEGNDQNDDNHLKDTFYTNYLLTNFSQNLISKQREIDNLLINWIEYEANKIENINKNSSNKFSWIIKRLKLFSLRTNFIRLFQNSSKKDVEYPINQNFEKILLMAKNEVNDWGGEIIFLYLPDWYRYKFKKQNSENFHKKKDVIKIVRKNKIKIIDIEKKFSSFSDPLKLYALRFNHSHYNEEGYDIISQEIYDFMKND